MSKRNENLDVQIATLESEIDVLQRRWKPYARVQPGRPNTNGAFGPVYHPDVFLEKSEIATALDGKMIELAQLQRLQAEQVLAAYEASGTLSNAEIVFTEAEDAYQDAKRAFDTAQANWINAQGALDRQQERHGILTTDVARAEADGRRWTKELERDQLLEANVRSRMPGKVA
jgi:hypothetical protein